MLHGRQSKLPNGLHHARQSISWSVQNGSIVSQIGHNVTVSWNYPAVGSGMVNVGKLWVAESSNTNLDTCFGVSDTMSIVLAPASSPVNLAAVICDNEIPYIFGTRNLDVTGTYVDSLQNRFGCDSIVSLNLTVNPVSDTVITDTICSNFLPYNFNGQLITESGQFRDTLPNRFSCDSVVVLNLIINPAKTTNLAAVVCDDVLPYSFGSRSLAQTGLYVDTLTTVLGCDSIVILDLTVNPTYDDVLTINLTNETFKLGDEVLSQTGNYTQSFSTQRGCDSTVTVNLDVTDDLFVPNIITPNGDGKNDIFEIKDLSFFSPVQVKVYNRWGTLVYETTDYQNDWNGSGLAAGTYFIWLRTNRGQEYKSWVAVSY